MNWRSKFAIQRVPPICLRRPLSQVPTKQISELERERERVSVVVESVERERETKIWERETVRERERH